MSKPGIAARFLGLHARFRVPRLNLKYLKIGFGVLLLLLVFIPVFAAWLFYFETTRDIRIPDRAPGIAVLAADGSLLAEVGNYRLGPKLADLPDHVAKAILAVEDRTFYEHGGFDFSGLVRAFLANLQARRVVQGGSTLTQQLAKNLFLTSDRTAIRKAKEAALTLWLERNFSKDEILELYLDRVYFGAGATGIEAAAATYFEKTASELTLMEAAMLAAILKAPTTYNPLNNPEAARSRAEIVIAGMVETGAISPEAAAAAIRAPMPVTSNRHIPSTRYAVDWAVEKARELIGEPTQSIVIETTVDPHLHEVAEKALLESIGKNGTKLNVSQGAVLLMDSDGAIKVMIGGRDYRESQFNRAASAKRQPGSAFKPFVYLAALEAGKTKESTEVDEPIDIDGWKPENYDGKYRGSLTLDRAFANSVNTVPIKLTAAVGPEKVAEVARRLGIQSEMTPVISLSLGTSELTLLELANSYDAFAQGGKFYPNYIIRRIVAKDGRVLFEHVAKEPETMIADRELEAMQDMLLGVVKRGTARSVRVGKHLIGGKTGTSQEYRDAWFIGFSKDMVGGVWIGNDDNSPMLKVTGGSIPATIFTKVMTEALKNYRVKKFEKSTLVSQSVVEKPTRRYASAAEQVAGQKIWSKSGFPIYAMDGKPVLRASSGAYATRNAFAMFVRSRSARNPGMATRPVVHMHRERD